MSAKTIVLGSVNVDLVIRGERLPAPGETVLGGDYFQAAGGKGANQAVAAARAARGGVKFVAAVGDDSFGSDALAGFVREGIDTDEVCRVHGHATGIALILVDSQGQNMISVASGANSALSCADVDAISDDAFATASVFLASLETPIATVRRGLERARQHGLITILNPAPANREILCDGFLELVDILTPNETELEILTARSSASKTDQHASPFEQQALELRALGCRTVIATLGANGCLVVGSTIVRVQAFPVTAVDATAAGDAFNGALAARLAEGADLSLAVRFASAAAALSVTRPGAQPSLPIRTEIDQLLSQADPV